MLSIFVSMIVAVVLGPLPPAAMSLVAMAAVEPCLVEIAN